MKPTPIPDDEIWPEAHRVVIGPPKGHEMTGDIRAVEMLRYIMPDGVPAHAARFIPTERDLERLNAGEPIWLVLYGGHVQPFNVDLTEEG